MNFFKLLQSLDELLYEIMSWLVFYPVTLWRVIRRPREMMDNVESELAQPEEAQFADVLSPPLFLILSLLLSHGIELALVGESELVMSKTGLSALIDSDTNLVMLRVATFSLFPLVMAARLLRLRHQPLDRDTLRAPFYSQCYITAPFALALGIAAVLFRQPSWVPVAGLALFGVAFLIFGTLEVGWFARLLGVSRWWGFVHASVAMLIGGAGMAMVGWLFV